MFIGFKIGETLFFLSIIQWQSKKIIAKTKNEKIKNLADSIIKSQLQEIQLMNDILQDT